MSPSINHEWPFMKVFAHFRPVWQLRFGLKPCDWSLKLSSKIGSMMDLTTSWTSLSFIEGIPSGLIFPGFPGLGIITRLTPVHSYCLCRTASLISSIFFFVRLSIFFRSGPGVFDPLFCLSLRYAACQIPSRLRSHPRSSKTFSLFSLHMIQCLVSLQRSLCNSPTGANLFVLPLVTYDLNCCKLRCLGLFPSCGTIDPLPSR